MIEYICSECGCDDSCILGNLCTRCGSIDSLEEVKNDD